MLNFSVADDIFVRKDLLKTKYNFVDFAAAEEYGHWCSHYSKCNFWGRCAAPTFSQILEDFIEQNPIIYLKSINDTS